MVSAESTLTLDQSDPALRLPHPKRGGDQTVLQATADKARAKADLKAEIADRAAEQVDKDTGGQEPEEPQEEMPDYDEAV